MADFPSLAPVSRRYNTGVFPSTVETGFGGGKVIFRHGVNQFGIRLALQFVALTEENARLIRDHYREKQNNLLSFRLASATFKHANVLWKYASEPEETHRENGRIDVAVQLLNVRS
jgi:hypothetical protein